MFCCKNNWLTWVWVFIAGAMVGLVIGLAWPQSAKNPQFFKPDQQVEQLADYVLRGEIVNLNDSSLTVRERLAGTVKGAEIKVKITKETVLYKVGPKTETNLDEQKEVAALREQMSKETSPQKRSLLQNKIKDFLDQAQVEQAKEVETLQAKIEALPLGSLERLQAETELLNLTSPEAYTIITVSDLAVGQQVTVTPAGNPQARPLIAQKIISRP